MTTATTRAVPNHSLTGTGTLVALAVRADRVRLIVWIGAIGLYLLSANSAVREVYATAADRQVRAQLISSPTAAFLAGPGYGVENYTPGAMFANEQTLYLMVAMIILNVSLVVRHTRANEESGRSELVRSSPIGRHASLAAALLVAALADLSFLAVATGALTISDLPFSGAATVATGIALCAFTFAAVAAVAAQLTEHARTATGSALGLVVVLYALRALGDTERSGGSALSWLSPLAWTQQCKPFVDLRLWPLALYPLVAVPAAAMAFAIEARRDYGAGVLAVRPGRATAPRWLDSPLALAWRLERPSVIGWTVGTTAAAAAFGGVVGTASDALETSSNLTDLIRNRTGTLTETLVSTILLVITLAVAGFAVSSIGRVRTEEISGRAEGVLVAGVTRTRWLLSITAVTVASTAAMLALAGLAMGVTSTGATGIAVTTVLGQAMSYLPAMLVFIGFGLLLFGFSADAMRWAYLPVVYAALVGIVGVLLQLPQWARNLSPVTHVPAIGAFTWTPLVISTAIAVASAVVAVAAYARRDLR